MSEAGQRSAVSGRLNGGAYAGASHTSQDLALWQPQRASADSNILDARDTLVARARDLERNNGWISGAVQRHVDEGIGARFTLQARPDWKALGQSADWAREWSREVESRFRAWAYDPRNLCDATERMNFSALLGLLFRQRFVEGASFAVIEWSPGRGGYSTAITAVDTDRLSNPRGAPDTDTLRGGVELSQAGAAVAYHIQNRHPYDHLLNNAADQWTWRRFPKRETWGRPRVIHQFDVKRAGQHREG